MAGNLRTLIEAKEYSVAKDALGRPSRIDQALTALTWAISTAPEDFDEVPGMPGVRIAKTDPTGELPRLIVWFSIVDEDDVLLRYIEASPEIE